MRGVKITFMDIFMRILLQIVQEAEDAGEVRELHARLGKVVEQVESGREAVLTSHRAVLDFADSAIARVEIPDCITTVSSSMYRVQKPSACSHTNKAGHLRNGSIHLFFVQSCDLTGE